MYVCVCHAVTEDDVRRHADAGVCSAKDLRAACGMRPGCGHCVLAMGALLGAGRGADRAPVGVSAGVVA
jgi:bacterioferritin-associated ferredoxin